MPQLGPLDLLVLQSTPFCNLNCTYCYLPDRANKSTMPLNVLEKTIILLMESGLVDEQFTIVWHAGEPLVIGLDYYQKAINLIETIKSDDCRIGFSFQTNGVLINEKWCKLFLKHAINIGVSIDGPQFIHDRNRLSLGGKGSYRHVERGIKILNKFNVPFHTISVLTDYSLDFPNEIFNFMCNNEISHCAFNIEEKESNNVYSSLQNDSAEMRTYEFFKEFMNLNQRAGNPLVVRELDQSMSIIRNWNIQKPDWLTNNSQELIPYKIISVDYKGNYSTFSPELLNDNSPAENKFILGNVFTTDFAQAIETRTFKDMHDEINSGIAQCRKNCQYFQFCGGGSPSNKYYENGTFDCDETMYCTLHKQVPFDVALEFLENSLNKPAQ